MFKYYKSEPFFPLLSIKTWSETITVDDLREFYSLELHENSGFWAVHLSHPLPKCWRFHCQVASDFTVVLNIWLILARHLADNILGSNFAVLHVSGQPFCFYKQNLALHLKSNLSCPSHANELGWLQWICLCEWGLSCGNASFKAVCSKIGFGVSLTH